MIGAALQPGTTGTAPHVARLAPSGPGHDDAPDLERSGASRWRQEALGLSDIVGSVDTDGSLGTLSLATGEVGVTEAGPLVAAGVVHAMTAPPSEAASVRASRTRLNMVGRPPLIAVPAVPGTSSRGWLGRDGSDLTNGSRKRG